MSWRSGGLNDKSVQGIHLRHLVDTKRRINRWLVPRKFSIPFLLAAGNLYAQEPTVLVQEVPTVLFVFFVLAYILVACFIVGRMIWVFSQREQRPKKGSHNDSEREREDVG